MSREIKFRAWYKADLELGAPIKFTMDTKDDEIKFIATDEGFSFSYPFALVFTDDDFIIEQYTGLKDKNGKEIYINDILKVTLENTREIFICLSDYKEFILNSIFSAYHKLEVIGNIHENKELLK